MGGSKRGEPLNLCGAELEKLLLSENQTPYLLCLFAPVIFLEKKKGLTTKKLQRGLVPVSASKRGISFIFIIYADFL